MWLGVVVLIASIVSVNGEQRNVSNCVNVHSEMAKFVEKLSPLMGRIFKAKDEAGTYEYHLGICTTVGSSGIAATQISLTDPTKNYTIGKLDSPAVLGGSDWINIIYGGGDHYGSHCRGDERQAHIMLVCDTSTGDLVVYDEYNSATDKGDCYYSFELRTQYACSPNNQLSFGSIFLIIFFSAAAIYFLLGICIMRFARHSRGIEQIPHVYFWVDLGNLIADGCELVFRCGGAARRSTTHITPGYGGIGDDQLADEEEDKDDNLLPM